MQRKLFTRILAFVLVAVMTISLVPVTASAAPAEYESTTHERFSKTTSTIAPGVTQDICYAYAKSDDQQMVYYIATADITRDDVHVYANYMDNQCKVFGLQKLIDQLAAAQKKHSNPEDPQNYIENYQVVAGVNGDFYNMATGKPTYAFAMEGTVVNKANGSSFFAVREDGSAVIGVNDAEWESLNAESRIMEAVGGNYVLVQDGKDVTNFADTTRHSRTCVGITADGKVVLMVLDGRQEPFSCGGSMHELAQIMLEAGCVEAINVDGGGSTTFAARQEGDDEITVINRPSDGSERSISSSLMIVSTVEPSDKFHRAALEAEHEYVTPGSEVDVEAVGLSSAGTPADIPGNVAWQLKDASMGTVENGLFKSSGTAGDAVVQMTLDGAVVGETTIHVVVPTAISFKHESQIISYGKTVKFDLEATVNDGLNEVVLKDGDITLSLSDEKLGTIDGTAYTANAQSVEVTEGVITAALAHNSSVTDTLKISLTNLPDEPVVIEDFEESPEYALSYQDDTACEVKIVDSAAGKVHGGDKALAVTYEIKEPYGVDELKGGISLGSCKATDGKNFKEVDLTNAKNFGMWVYLPEDSESSYIQLSLSSNDEAQKKEIKLFDYGYTSTEAGHRGWKNFEIDLTGYNDGNYHVESIDFYVSSNNDQANKDMYGYNRKDHQSVFGPYTFYVDDITVDYVDTGVDREDPEFEYVRFIYDEISDAEDLNGQTIAYSDVYLTAKAKDTGVGINAKSAKAYIDGVEVTKGFKCMDSGVMTIDEVTLADGTHTFTFVISDKNGNCDYVTRQITINANSDIGTAQLAADAGNAKQPLLGSLYWMNLEVDDIKNVDEVKMLVNLNASSDWELDHMEVAEGFKASYEVDEVTNDAEITITKTAKTGLTGKAVLAKLPARLWYKENLDLTKGKFMPVDIKVMLDKGVVTFSDGKTSTFSMKKIDVDSELYDYYDGLQADGVLAAKTKAHTHTPEAMEDTKVTCTTDGYEGRTFCQGCNSVVDWGKTEKAQGHMYENVNGVLTCSCGDALSDLTGIYKTKDAAYYAVNGKLKSGWQYINNEYHYFDTTTYKAYTGEHQFFGTVTYEFTDEGKLVDGVWYKTNEGTRYYYGPGSYEKGWKEINGKTYFFKNYVRYEGLRFIVESNSVIAQWYDFGDDGALVEKLTHTGLLNVDGNVYYLINGESQFGMYKVNSYYYYFLSDTRAALKSGSYNCTNMRESKLPVGTYTFDDRGRMIRGDEATRKPAEELKFSGASLTLQDNLSINYKAKKNLFTEVGFTDPYVVFELNGKEIVVDDYRIVGNEYIFDFTNIAPNQMKDTIKATLYADFCGREYASTTREYSVLIYCDNMLSKYNTDSYAKFRTLLVDLLNYGAASQLYTDYKTDDLANAGLTDTQKAWGTQAEREYKSVLNTAYETIENPEVSWKGAGLNLKDRVEIRLTIAADDIENLSIKAVGESGDEWMIPAAKFEDAGNGRYNVSFNGLNAGQMSETIYFTVYKGSRAVSNNVSYSVESYVNSKINSSDTKLVELIKAMMKYGDSAYNYAK